MKALALTLVLLASRASAEVVTIEVDQLEPLLAKGIPIVDVRTASEWQQSGILKGSHPLTYFDEQGRSDGPAWMKEFSKVAGPDDEVIIICRSGQRSGMVASFLDSQMKYRKVYTVEGGVMGWKALGKPTVRP